jgi:YfiH family protein
MPELLLPDAFEWATYPWGALLRCRELAAVAPHGFTHRRPDLSVTDGGGRDGWRHLEEAFDVSRHGIVRLRQMHGADVFTVAQAEAPRQTADEWAAADASVSNHPSLAVSVRVADCVPVLLADRRTGAVAAIHAGWRGAAAGVIAATVGRMSSAFSSAPSDLIAAVGPSIGPCCYRVGPELREVFVLARYRADRLDQWFRPFPPVTARRGVPGSDPASHDGRPPAWLDMWRTVEDLLADAGLQAHNIHAARVCTSCYRETFHSYRVDGPNAGRMVGVIRRHE